MAASHLPSEFDLIKRWFRPLADETHSLNLLDDAALLSITGNGLLPADTGQLVLTKDILAAGRHFFAADPPKAIAEKALAVNLSDLAAMGAKPLAYLMGLAVPGHYGAEEMQEFAKGLSIMGERYGLTLLGGDTIKAADSLVISITMLGTVPPGKAVRRAGAKNGDFIIVTGTLGDSALGLDLHQQPDLAAKWDLSAAQTRNLLGRYQRPVPRCEISEALQQFAHAAIDISDGLLADIGHVCNASAVKAQIHLEKIPLSPGASKAVAHDVQLCDRILTGGDDYEIAAFVANHSCKPFQEALGKLGIDTHIIGQVHSAAPEVVVHAHGNLYTTLKSGYKHF